MTRLPASTSGNGVSPETMKLQSLLRQADTLENPVFLFDEVQRWPAGLLDRLTAWGLTVTEAAELLMEDLPFLKGELGKARSRVSRAANAGKFKTNGKKKYERRIDAGSFAQWRLEQRDADLEKEDEPEIVTRGTRYGKMAAGASARRNSD